MNSGFGLVERSGSSSSCKIHKKAFIWISTAWNVSRWHDKMDKVASHHPVVDYFPRTACPRKFVGFLMKVKQYEVVTNQAFCLSRSLLFGVTGVAKDPVESFRTLTYYLNKRTKRTWRADAFTNTISYLKYTAAPINLKTWSHIPCKVFGCSECTWAESP